MDNLDMWHANSKPNEEQQSKKLHSLIKKGVALVSKFRPQHEYRDRVWKFYLQVGGKWCLFGARKDGEYFIFFSSKFKSLVFDVKQNQVVEADPSVDYEKILPPILDALAKKAIEIKKDSISANKNTMKKLSPHMREGLIHRSFVRKLIPEWLRYDQELGVKNIEAMIKLIEDYGSQDRVEKMTAEKYFKYCKVAYLANLKHGVSVKSSQSGKEMFARLADNRDGGLKEIDQKSTQAFIDWFDGGKSIGGHPWEIYRGGNTTHIDLYVERYLNEWRVCLSAYASTRLAETCRIALALKKAGLPFKLCHEKSYLKRLLCDDFVGIIPAYDSVHRGWQRFPEDFHVADAMHFSWFQDERNGKWPRPAREIASLVYWLPEEPAVLKL